ncbi:MAG: thymidylate kinase [Alistipes sp.]|nr:thymidylate kinase [Alistipes senegalensis]MCM1249589.1 thymidylate kinase [Alistipes sp.]
MLIVLEGLDGAGKSTQIALLRDFFARQGIGSAYLHFPRFDAPVYGELIARFLRGEFGGVGEVDPYLVALLFAGDRADAAPQLRQWMAEGKAVILDRYVYSNVGYQCAKLPAGEERRRLARWILDLEFEHNDLPRPDLSIFLDVPFSFTERKLSAAREGDDRCYLQGAEDIHESSLALQRAVREVYLEAAATDPALRIVDCSDAHGGMETPEAIFARIRELSNPLIESDAK